MSKAFEEINAGLDDAIKHAKGKKSKVVVHKPETINVQTIRKKTVEKLASLNPDDLREDKTERKNAAKAARELVEKFSSLRKTNLGTYNP